MRKTFTTILCSALILASSIQLAAAGAHHADHPNARKTSHRLTIFNEQFRNSRNEQSRDSNASGVCGLFPGPCQ
jgi:hypothetical protein